MGYKNQKTSVVHFADDVIRATMQTVLLASQWSTFQKAKWMNEDGQMIEVVTKDVLGQAVQNAGLSGSVGLNLAEQIVTHLDKQGKGGVSFQDIANFVTDDSVDYGELVDLASEIT